MLTKARKSTLTRLARAWHKAHEREEALKAQRRELGERVMALLKESGATSVEVTDDEAVQLEVSPKKAPTKGEIVARFGKDGEDFWAGLTPRVSEYLTVIQIEED